MCVYTYIDIYLHIHIYVYIEKYRVKIMGYILHIICFSHIPGSDQAKILELSTGLGVESTGV